MTRIKEDSQVEFEVELSISERRSDSSDIILAASRFDEDFKFVDAEIITESDALLTRKRDDNA